MKVSDKIVVPSAKELVVMKKERQLFKLNKLSKAIALPGGITYWEELTCTGYNPKFRRLEAVVNVKQASGYNGNLCSNGSLEYVRFFMDFHDGAGFQDMGYTSFKVADISDLPAGPQHPLSYMAYLFIDDAKYKKFLNCDTAVIPTLRAVLSWNSVPSIDPNQMPYYGNRIDADIQLGRKYKFFPWQLAEIPSFKEFASLIDPKLEIELKPPKAAPAETIFKLNKAAGVPDHRTFYSTIGAKLNSTLDFSKAVSKLNIESLDKFAIDISKFLDFFDGGGKEANVSFEELTCLGLNTATDSLGAVIHIKRNSGFNGNLCTNGSNEHVAFWADWNNDGTFEEYLGTVSLNVHDIQNIPAGGLFYNVLLPFNVGDRLKTCNAPNIIRVRAVLSWESLPSTTDPNQLNTWGNFRDALVQLRPALAPGSGIHSKIYLVGSVDRDMIDPVQHLYNYQAVAPSIYNNRPWGGAITFNGIIDRNGFGGVIEYRLLYKKLGAPDSDYKPISTSETFTLDDLNTPAGAFPDPQTDPDGWFEYKQNPAIGLYNIYNYLGTWNASALPDGGYTIRFVHTDENGLEVIADEFSVTLSNKGMTISPTANTAVDTNFDIDLVIDGGDCHSYTPNAPMINGHLRAVHPYFASWYLDLQPTSHTHGIEPSPTSRSYSALGDSGDTNAPWTLDTNAPWVPPQPPKRGLDPCGYTVSLGAYTRVILNSWAGFPHYAPKAVGFAKLP